MYHVAIISVRLQVIVQVAVAVLGNGEGVVLGVDGGVAARGGECYLFRGYHLAVGALVDNVHVAVGGVAGKTPHIEAGVCVSVHHTVNNKARE